MERLARVRARAEAVRARLPDHLRLKVANVVVYWSLVAFHLYNTFWYRPEFPAKETYLSPGAYAYWVWPLIHLLLLGFTVCQWIPRARSLVIESIGYRFAVIGLISAAYLYFQYRRWYILSFFLSLALLAVVSKVFYIVRTRRRVGPEPTRVEWAIKETCIHMPFSFYHAWSLVLMILSLVQAFGKDVHREHAGGWTRVFVWLALLFLTLNSIGYAYASEVGDLAGTAVITYVLWAIFEHQTTIHTIRWSALVFAIFSSLAFLVTLRSSLLYLTPSATSKRPNIAHPNATAAPLAPPGSPAPRRPRAGTRTRSALLPSSGSAPSSLGLAGGAGAAEGSGVKRVGGRKRSATAAAASPSSGVGARRGEALGPPLVAKRKISSATDERSPLLPRRVSEGGPANAAAGSSSGGSAGGAAGGARA